jgi:hypothetical protein
MLTLALETLDVRVWTEIGLQVQAADSCDPAIET